MTTSKKGAKRGKAVPTLKTRRSQRVTGGKLLERAVKGKVYTRVEIHGTA
jgi:hypothetical protein